MLTQRFSLSTQNLRFCRFGRNLRLVLLLAWDTLFPTMGFLPVTMHTRAIMRLQNSEKRDLYHIFTGLLKSNSDIMAKKKEKP